jgi:hypothetical protein
VLARTLLTDDCELGHHRDLQPYGAQVSASPGPKLEDLTRRVNPGCIVDTGCGRRRTTRTSSSARRTT